VEDVQFGGLCSELHKEGGALAKKSATLFTDPIGWLEKQFRAAGHDKDSRELAMHLFSAFSGDGLPWRMAPTTPRSW